MVKVIAVMLLGWNTFAFATPKPGVVDKMVLAAEQDTTEFLQRYTVLYTSEKLELATNNNAFCGPQKVGRIGHFSVVLNDAQKAEREFLEQVYLRKVKPVKNYSSAKEIRVPHRMRFLLGPNDVTAIANTKPAVQRALEASCGEDRWEPIDGAVVEIVRQKEKPVLQVRRFAKGKLDSKKEMPLDVAPCQKVGDAANKKDKRKVWDCKIGDLGVTRLWD